MRPTVPLGQPITRQGNGGGSGSGSGGCQRASTSTSLRMLRQPAGGVFRWADSVVCDRSGPMDHVELVLFGVLVAVAALSGLARWLGVPYPIALVVGGSALGFI